MTPINGVTERIIGAAIRIHRKYGPGLLESVYTLTLAQELLEEGLEVEVSKPLGLEHKGLKIHRAYVVDLLPVRASARRYQKMCLARRSLDGLRRSLARTA